ncbi:DUF6495 family protein [Christiangramia sp. OXR-203]|jgi:hypothetical protein|uniref:DUF6495 family protein n=1 Tax=Christiangramia sp. OXR-203 TaxID=3100176 RepID=UPI002AC8958D|nr:DUF6495 family protein [Christiangramia sp. OXR-203]WPY97465.1 DUF6495 family protein [Christiangramia sp. OXR-203]
MKYARLTKEQFEEMHQEFINFLATQSITGEEWDKIKKEQPKVAEDEMDLFSDLVWEGVLNKVEYLEHFSPNQVFLFYISEVSINLIAIKVENESVDITTREGYQWLQTNLMNEMVNIYTSSKVLSEDRNKDIFALIKQGANITKGELYAYFKNIVDKDA